MKKGLYVLGHHTIKLVSESYFDLEVDFPDIDMARYDKVNQVKADIKRIRSEVGRIDLVDEVVDCYQLGTTAKVIGLESISGCEFATDEPIDVICVKMRALGWDLYEAPDMDDLDEDDLDDFDDDFDEAACYADIDPDDFED